ncbi:acyl-CoA--sterol O-acyltransferase 1-like [Humulus lupulus]|uniref:acyl-CoA--sterol O-acyltransferase 1-like n=1 Tax=Humulus lupulus TaxID=3486 RepID=UPI002B40F877|nr:acyl-CoA--sterol O-acyltransferase 1-like [Humulus lupulus]
MEGEMNNFIKVWFSVLVSLSYCYVMAKLVSNGIKRLIFFLPIIFIFFFLPLKLNSVNLVGGTSFCISWLANFKLLLLAFNKGPLASNPSSSSSLSFGRFIVIASFPIEIKESNTNPSSQNSHFPTKTHKNKQNPSQKNPKPVINFTIKTLLLAILIRVCNNNQDHNFHPNVVLILYFFLTYLVLETILVTVATLVRVMAGVELEPQFNEPYLSTSLQDFWGRRWNLMVTRILRPTVFVPIFRFSSTLIGHKWAGLPAVIVTFVVSGLVHELMYFYMVRTPPTWEVTSFFVLHGLCLTVEIVLKKGLSDTWRLPGLVSGALTIGFVMLTSFWLYFPQLIRCKADVRALEEYAKFGNLLGKMGSQSYHLWTKFRSQF